jgi:lipoprotein-anchoring transpeptidase ErfK/SrfK
MRLFLLTIILASFSICVADDSTPTVSVSPALKLQILLDRAGYSPGEIDGHHGRNTIKALVTYQRFHDLTVTGKPDAATLNSLGSDSIQALKNYTISERDTSLDFMGKFPKDLQQQTKLDRLEYSSLVEMLGENFHVNPGLLRKLNPRAKFQKGETIIVPNVTSLDDVIYRYSEPRNVRVYVSRENWDLLVRAENGEILMYAPVTQGDQLAPLPLGEWKVTKIEDYPYFNYNPKLFTRPNKKHKGGFIPPGPNNPVGIIWIDLDLEHYGLHGTSAPEQIGHSSSNGCIRLTNWDVFKLSTFVQPGTEVNFVKEF